MIIDLKTAKIKKGRKNGSQPYIYIERDGRSDTRESSDVIRIAFTSDETMSKWMKAIMVASLTDDELMSSARDMSDNI